MKWARYIAAALAAGIVQATFLAGWRPWAVVPALVLVTAVRAAVVATASQAVAVAVAGGLVLDLAAGDRFGVHTSFLVLVVLAVSWLRRGGTQFGLSLELLALVGASVLNGVVEAALLLGHASLQPGVLVVRVLVLAAVNMALALLLYIPLGWALKGGEAARVPA